MDTFTQLPLTMDPQTKALTASSPSVLLANELATLNALHRTLLSLDPPATVPPPPVPVSPKRSAQINKLREAGNTSFRKGAHQDAIRMYSLALDMALQRPPWEPVGLLREEVSGLYANRAQAWMELREWVQGAVDAECSVEMKRVGNGKGWWRRGKCLVEMGRVEDAREWVGRGLETEGEEGELKTLMGEIEARLKK